MNIVFDVGSGGRATVFLKERGDASGVVRAFDRVIRDLADLKIGSHRFVVVEFNPYLGKEWLERMRQCLLLLESREIRQCSLIACGAASALGQSLMVEHPRLFRRGLFADMRVHAHTTWFTRLVDWIEQRLPLGLPLRIQSEDLDSRSFLHRIRTPVVILLPVGATFEERRSAEYFAQRIPNAWLESVHSALSSQEGIRELNVLVKRFEELPARAPQG